MLNSELANLKTKLKATWSAGNYGEVAKRLASNAELFINRNPVARNSRVLDVACGTGQVAFLAANAGAQVWGVDIADNLIEQARQRCLENGLAVQFDVGDAEQLPYDDNHFDDVYSLIGAMFAPRPDRVVAELTRVCRPGGRVVMGNWTPGGFIGQMFKTVAAHVAPSPLMPSPALWGDPAVVEGRFAGKVAQLNMEKQFYDFHYDMSPAQVVSYYRTYFGPVQKAFAALSDIGQQSLFNDLQQLWSSNNLANDGTTHVKGEFLEVVAVCR